MLQWAADSIPQVVENSDLMNRNILILRTIAEDKTVTQRGLSRKCGLGLGTVNSTVKKMMEDGCIEKKDSCLFVTEKGFDMLKSHRTEKAVIMAAGFGSRFVPLTLETPKGLLEVLGEPMIERQIRQLHEAGITDISIIVGYMKERFEYLADKYGVSLIYNPEFTDKNTLASLYHAREAFRGANTYILSSDNWLRENLYHAYEPDAWYAAEHSEGDTSEWVLETDAKGRITDTYPGGRDCDYMYGPAYFTGEFSESFIPVLEKYYEMPGTENYYWEHVLMEMLNGRAAKRLAAYFGLTREIKNLKSPEIYINLQDPGIIYEFENLEELRRFDTKYENDSGSKAMQLVSRIFGIQESEISRIRCLKSGMTNNSWLFSVGGSSYISRIPGEGTDKLINRREEAAVYEAVGPLNITEELIYFDPETGYKISRFYEDSRNADASEENEMRRCMELLRKMHESGVSVNHSFDIGERLDWYEKLILEASGFDPDIAEEESLRRILEQSVPFKDYWEVRKRKDQILSWLKKKNRPSVLAHIDPVPDNFIFLPDGSLRLIDWEYAGMADPLIDISMCAIYSFMDEPKINRLAEMYFRRAPEEEEKEIIYAYVALGGLLWSLWGIYKEKLGVIFTDYTLKMYRYFKTYSSKLPREA